MCWRYENKILDNKTEMISGYKWKSAAPNISLMVLEMEK